MSTENEIVYDLNKLFSGTGENYRELRPIDVFVLNTNSFRWKEIPKPTGKKLFVRLPESSFVQKLVHAGAIISTKK